MLQKSQLNLTPDQIYNADESGVFYKIMQNKTLVSFNKFKAAVHKVSEERIILLACTNATGMCKVKPLVIGKSLNSWEFKGFEDNPVIYKSTKNAWMTFALFNEGFIPQYVCT